MYNVNDIARSESREMENYSPLPDRKVGDALVGYEGDRLQWKLGYL